MPLTAEDVAVLDRNAEALGVSTSSLMQRAGQAVADAVRERHPQGRVVVLVGPGNNGGDGSVAAAALKRLGRDVRVFVAGGPEGVRSEIAKTAMEQARKEGVEIERADVERVTEACRDAAVVLDALLGVGATGALREPVLGIVQAVRDSGRPVVAVDLPTGHDTATPLVAQTTVTMHARKSSTREEVCGEIVVADIGIPEEAQTHVGPGDLWVRYPRTPPASRKGKMGRLLIVGGGPYTGAPVLSGMGAFATGTDMVHMALPKSAARVAQEVLLEAIVHPVTGQRLDLANAPNVEALLERVDVLLLGPGLGRDPDTLAAARDIVKVAAGSGKRCVLDGDAFSAYRKRGEEIRREGFVLTPHAGEFKTLTGYELPEDVPGRVNTVQGWLEDSETVVLLKGKKDVIVKRDAHAVNGVHDPVMTTAGTGDVLAGVTAALLGRGMDPFQAAKVAAYLNGLAGQRARRDLGYGVRARDVARRIPRVLAEVFAQDVPDGG